MAAHRVRGVDYWVADGDRDLAVRGRLQLHAEAVSAGLLLEERSRTRLSEPWDAVPTCRSGLAGSAEKSLPLLQNLMIGLV